MRQNDDGRTVAAMDMLVPGVIYKISPLLLASSSVCEYQIFSTIQKNSDLGLILHKKRTLFVSECY